MVKDKELEALRKQLRAGERQVKKAEAKSRIEAEKRLLKRKLFILKNPRKVALARRLGKGLKITGTKVGTSLIKQGKLIAAQQERDRRLEVARSQLVKRQPTKKKVKVRKSKKRSSSREVFNPLEELDF